jgi:hypothetical protein
VIDLWLDRRVERRGPGHMKRAAELFVIDEWNSGA